MSVGLSPTAGWGCVLPAVPAGSSAVIVNWSAPPPDGGTWGLWSLLVDLR